jgi:hypothetical protein
MDETVPGEFGRFAEYVGFELTQTGRRFESQLTKVPAHLLGV